MNFGNIKATGSDFLNGYLCLLICFLGFRVCTTAQIIPDSASRYKITSWTTDDGLPSNTIIDFFQDKNGYLWLGSFQGLSRFDGTQFTIYNKSNRLNSNYAHAVVGDVDGNLWVGTDRGLLLLNEKVKSVPTGFEYHIESLCVDDDKKRIWIGTRGRGFFLYDIGTNTFQQIEGINKSDIINDILKDKQGSVWLAGEKNGLMEYREGRWRQYGKAEGLSINEIISLNAGNDGVLFVGTTSGLYVRQPDNTFKELEKFKGMRINKIKHDKNNNLWVGTVNGLYYETAKGEWIFLSRKDGLSNNDIRDIYLDNDGAVWLGTYRGGLNQLRPTRFFNYSATQGLDVEAVGALCKLSSNELLIGSTEGKLFLLRNNRITPYTIKTEIKQRIYSMMLDDRKNLWIASYDGLLLITPNGKEKLFTEKEGLFTRQLRIIFQDSKQNYWIGTRTTGLIKMTFDDYPFKPRFDRYLYEEFNKVNSTFIMDIQECKSGSLLISTNNGGLTIISKEGSLTNLGMAQGLESNTTFTAKCDNENVIWISTPDGLTRLKNGKTFPFTNEEGMPHENPMDIIEDEFGFFWLPTQKGTIRVSKKQLNDFAENRITKIEWKLFDSNNDLVQTECTGTARSLKDQGRIWIPMIGGLMTVKPSSIHAFKKMPSVRIEKLLVDDHEMDIRKPVVIEAGSHRIQFEFVALTLFYPNSAHYKFKLDGNDKEWIDAGQNRQAVYTNLSGGEYTFKVRASNTDGVWNEMGTSFQLTIQPHFYETLWFYFIFVWMILFAITLSTRVKTRQIARRNKALQQLIDHKTAELKRNLDDLKRAQVQLVQSEKMASLGVLTAGIAHEINNPVNFISVGISALEKKLKQLNYYFTKVLNHEQVNQEGITETQEKINQLIQDVKIGTTRTEEIISSLRTFSRLNEADLKLADINQGIESTLVLLNSKLKDRIEVVRNLDKNLPQILCNPGQLNQVFMNVLTNAIDAIKEKGKITITTNTVNSHVEINIADTGCGMTSEVQEKLFEPFFTTKGIGAGTGLGLSISYGIIQKHNGTITVSSEINKGSEFVIKLPTDLRQVNTT